MREHDSRTDGRQMLRLPAAIAVALSSLAIMACASPTAQATDPTATPTATPVSTGEEQAVAEPTHTPTATPAPAPSEGQESGSDPEPTSTPTPTSTPASSEEQASDPVPPATTTVAVTTTPVVVSASPVGDCYGGALSEDPIICYIVEQAEAEGLIDVLGVYEGGEEGIFHLYVSISGEVTRDLLRFSILKSSEFYYKWPELLPEEKYGLTRVTNCTEFPECYMLGIGWDSGNQVNRYILPEPSRYQWAALMSDGGSGRRTVPGWASWRQLWPRVSAEEGMAGGTGGGPAFDVSDVDVTNFPEIDVNVCARVFYGTSCGRWLDFPDMGIAGVHGGGGGRILSDQEPSDGRGWARGHQAEN